MHLLQFQNLQEHWEASPDCPKLNLSKYQPQRFERSILGSQPKTWHICPHCSARFMTKNHYGRHLKKHMEHRASTQKVYQDSINAIAEAEAIVNVQHPVGSWRPGSSFVWDYAQKVSRDEAVCKICKRKLNTSGSSTSGIRHHLKRWHNICYKKT